jgi:hypothetical protein
VADPFLDGDTGEVGDLLPGTGQTVEYGGFAGVGISGEGNRYLTFSTHGSLALKP